MKIVNLYIQKVDSLNDRITYHLNDFCRRLQNYNKFNIITYPNLADIQIAYLFELSELNLLTNLPIILFIFFKPIDEELNTIMDTLSNKNIIKMYSPFSIEGLDNIVFSYPIKSRKIQYSKNKYKINKYEGDLPNYLEINSDDYDIFDASVSIQDFFDFTLVDNLDEGKLVYNTGEVYRSEAIKDLRLESIQQKHIYSDNWSSLLNNIYSTIDNYLVEKISETFFLPFLESTTDVIKKLDIKDFKKIIKQNSNLCYGSDGMLKEFLPWGLTISHSSIDKGITISKVQALLSFPDLKEYDKYYSLGFINCGTSKKEKLDYVFDTEGNNYSGILPISKWTIDEKITYIKKPNLNEEFGVVMFIENGDDYRFINNNISKVKHPIEIYYIEDLYDITGLAFGDNVKIIPIKKNKVDNENFLLEKLEALLISNFSRILYISDCNLIIDDLNSIKCEEDLFFASILDVNQINYYSFILKDFPLISKDLEKVNPDIFFINKIDWWFDILTAIGISNYYNLIKSNLEILYLARLLNNKKVKVTNENKGYLGYVYDKLFYGYPINTTHDFTFTRAPYWYFDEKYTHKICNIKGKTWCYNHNFNAIVMDKDEAILI